MCLDVILFQLPPQGRTTDPQDLCCVIETGLAPLPSAPILGAAPGHVKASIVLSPVRRRSKAGVVAAISWYHSSRVADNRVVSMSNFEGALPCPILIPIKFVSLVKTPLSACIWKKTVRR